MGGRFFLSDGPPQSNHRRNFIHQPSKIFWVSQILSKSKVSAPDVAAEIEQQYGSRKKATEPEQDRIVAWEDEMPLMRVPVRRGDAVVTDLLAKRGIGGG